MAKVALTHPHNEDVDTVKKELDTLATKLETGYGAACHWEGDTLCFNRSGVDGKVRVDSDQVAVDVRLGLLYSGFAGRFEQEIRRVLEEKLGPGTG